MSLRLKLSAAGLALSSLGAAHAAVVYGNPYSGNGNGDCVYNTTCGPIVAGDSFGAQQFTLTSSAIVTSASFISLVTGPTGTSVNYDFYTNSGSGLPGTLLETGSSPFTSVNDLGCDPTYCSTYDDYTYNFNVTPIALGPGTYYFAIQEVTSNFNDYLGAGVGGSGSAESDDGGATWYGPYPGAAIGYEPSVAVSLYGTAATPEPGAIYLLGSGLAGVAALRRRFVRR